MPQATIAAPARSQTPGGRQRDAGCSRNKRNFVLKLTHPVPSPASSAHAFQYLVEQDRAQDDRAAHDVLPIFGDIHQRHAVGDAAQEQHADQRSPDAALAAEERGSADDDGGDDVELHAGRHGARAGTDLRGDQDAAQAPSGRRSIRASSS